MEIIFPKYIEIIDHFYLFLTGNGNEDEDVAEQACDEGEAVDEDGNDQLLGGDGGDDSLFIVLEDCVVVVTVVITLIHLYHLGLRLHLCGVSVRFIKFTGQINIEDLLLFCHSSLNN